MDVSGEGSAHGWAVRLGRWLGTWAHGRNEDVMQGPARHRTDCDSSQSSIWAVHSPLAPHAPPEELRIGR
eukprot:5024968-Prymnesium_polylepis.1